MLQLRAARVARKLSQVELSKRCGIAQSTLAHFENGSRSPSLSSLLRLAEALNCTLDELCGRSPRNVHACSACGGAFCFCPSCGGPL